MVGDASAAPKISDRLSAQYGPVNLSRILCPRRLIVEGRENIGYVACLVPAYDCGVQIGLGLPGGSLARAWERTAGDEDEEILLPYYDQWNFTVGRHGDFESLASNIQPIPAPWPIGRRIIDAHLPRGGVKQLAPKDAGRVQVLKCALFSTQQPPAGAPADEEWSLAKRGELCDALNRPAAVAGDSAFPEEELPRVGPRIYAQFQRGERQVNVGDADWFGQLNSNPAQRIIAGLGTRVVEKDQEALMQAAWAQVGKVDDANRALRLMQYARFVGEALHRTLATLPLGTLAQVTRGLQGKIQLGGSALTVAGDVARSRVPPAALTGAFRRVARVSGPIALRLRDGIATQSIVAPGGVFRDFRHLAIEPDGIRGLSEKSLAAIPTEAIARVLDVPSEQARAVLRERLAPLREQPSVADEVLAPRATWRVAKGTIDLKKIQAERALGILEEALPSRPRSQPGRAEALGNLLAGLASTATSAVARRAKTLTRRVTRALPPAAPPFSPVAPGRLVPGPFVFSLAAPAQLAAVRPTVSSIANARLRTNATTAFELSLAGAQKLSASRFADQLSEIFQGVSLIDLPAPPDRPVPAITQSSLLAAIEPKTTVSRYAAARVGVFPRWLDPTWFGDGLVQPIMYAPEIKRPMYEALGEFDRDWLVPGLGTIAATDFLTLLSTNSAFTEAFLIGLSDEFGRELLWREYPTDQRGTYFKRFWIDNADELGGPIHQFTPTPLGSHLAGGSKDRVVLIVRAALFHRYPDAIISAMFQEPGSNPPTFVDPAVKSGHIFFHGHLAPDYVLVGFDLTVAQVKAGGWWFVISEHPTAPRFGLDEPDSVKPASIEKRDAFDWDDVALTADKRFLLVSTAPEGRPVAIEERASKDSIPWPPANAAMVARALLQNPFRAAFDGKKMLDPIS